MYRASASGRFVLAPTILLLLTALLTVSGQRALAQAPGSSARERQRFAAGWENGTPAVVTGEVRVFHTDDVANKRATDAYTIRDERSGRSFQLRFEQSAPNTLRTGQKVRVTGRSLGSELYVACCDSTTSSSVETLSEAVASPTGDQRTLVMIADLLDATVSCSVDYVRDTLFAPPTGTFDADGTGLSVNAEYRDNSSGAVSWSGQVVRTALSINSTDACTLDQYSRTLDTQAAALGVDVASYPRKMYVFPPMSQCPFVGASTQGGTPTSSFNFSCSNRGLYSHELGHALGMSHAAAYYDAYTAGAGGYSNLLSEYGDYSDSMGSSGSQFRGFNAPHREQMGWIPVGATQVVAQSGQYDLAPLSQPWAGSTPQVIKIPRQEGGYYYLSYRGGQAFERYIPSYATRVSVHRYGSPADVASGFTFLYATLASGRVGEDTFRDPANGITVTMRSGFGAAPGFGATVDIEIASPCARAAPSLDMSPQSQSGPAGGTSMYTVSVTNNDAPSCPAATFALSRTAPVGWSATLSTPQLTVGPGSSAQATLSMASPSSSQAGVYTATVNASDSAAPVHTVLSGAMYTVVGDSASPSAPVNLTATALTKSKQVKLSWGAASDNVGVTAYFIFKNGSVVGTSTTTSWTDSAWARGATYTYSVVATDAAGNTSAPSNAATVTLSAGGKTR